MINYTNIANAIEYYKFIGYKYIEVPWLVNKEAIDSTIPKGLFPTKCYDRYLVGSAEQSFVQLILDNKINNGKYVAASPCFRDELEDEWHQKTFFKVELINIGSNKYIDIINDAFKCFEYLGAKNMEVLINDDHLDVNMNGIEIGSYGFRKFNDFFWVYGTGIAEPRFTKAKGR